ncbi:MAG TPA: DUF433 domain-containing protein [Longimicrobiaceae bacterium]|nr:DUF433 domain-containing protein [Longimicrobiaceae bacterium]
MGTKDEALRLLQSLPDDISWQDLLRAVVDRAGGGEAGAGGRVVRELQAAYEAAGESGALPGGAVEREGPQPSGEGTGMGYQERITIEPGKRGGKPCVRGLRITVYDVLEYLASGMSEDEILADFPDLERGDIRACLAFAADRESRLVRIMA